MYTTEDRQHNNRILNLKMEGSICDPTPCQRNISPFQINEQVIRQVLISLRRQEGFAINSMNIPWRGKELLQHITVGLIPKVIQNLIKDKVAAVSNLPRW
ncbi:MAG: hypothetical protein EZS28_016366 [Streblomastix strix]|uniref:Uncharacterized protein n=1 Tax=Streblomastix strix TaxID=222440 RepID=A0A5J4VZV7_9EUKA|nr:MAG: hypothetical protein EZS28_016366 [Streblomastix strix]